MTKNEIKSNWNAMVLPYENFTNSASSYSNLIEWPAIKTLLPDLKNKKVLDLGCGTGRFAFQFEQYCPKAVLGIDISEEMVKVARKIASERKSSVTFMEGDIEDLSEVESGSYDFIFSSTALHYLQNLDIISKEVSRVLTQKGVCVLSVIHPLYSAQYPIYSGSSDNEVEGEWTLKYLNRNMRAYIQPWIEYNPEVENFTSKSYHHTISDYVNSFARAGLSVKEIVEPMPPEEWKTNNMDRYEDCVNSPIYAVFKLEKV